MTKTELEKELDIISSKLKEKDMENLRLRAQAVLMGIALEDFKTEEDQTITAILHGLIADYYKLKSEYHAFLREDINTSLADYR